MQKIIKKKSLFDTLDNCHTKLHKTLLTVIALLVTLSHVLEVHILTNSQHLTTPDIATCLVFKKEEEMMHSLVLLFLVQHKNLLLPVHKPQHLVQDTTLESLS